MGQHGTFQALTWARRSLTLSVAAAILASGCATKQGTGTLLGGAMGATAGGAIGAAAGRSSTATLLGAAIGGALGAFAGSTIGSRLDEADRREAEAAAQRALAEREAAVQ
ncbi:MAG: glycine zipper domain-containing protein, partial [Candidatus Rokuibacteriota bacterium]